MKKSRWLRAAAVSVMTACIAGEHGAGTSWEEEAYFILGGFGFWNSDLLEWIVDLSWFPGDLLDRDCGGHRET